MVDSKLYKEWFVMAQKDIRSAEILFEYDADYGIVGFHCQQAVEKYLKGYLLLQMGMLQEGHSLLRLCKKASTYESRFKDYVKDCTFLNTFYIETRYPAEDPLVVEQEDAQECLRIAKSIIEFVRVRVDTKNE